MASAEYELKRIADALESIARSLEIRVNGRLIEDLSKGTYVGVPPKNGKSRGFRFGFDVPTEQKNKVKQR